MSAPLPVRRSELVEVEWRARRMALIVPRQGCITAAKRRPNSMTRRKRRDDFAAKVVASRLQDVASAQLPGQLRLFAKRRDVRSEIGRFCPAQREIRHLGMRIKQKERQFFGTEVWPAGNSSERKNVRICSLLITVNQVTGGTPAFRKFRSMVRIGGHCG